MSSAVITSDWHGDAFTAGMNRFDDVLKGANEVADAAKNVDLFAFLGDLTDPDNVRSHRVSALACQTATKLNAMKKPNIWLTGNHDVIEDGQGTHTLSALKNAGLKHTMVIDEPMFGCIPNLGLAYIVALPFTARTHAYDADAFVRKAKEDYDKHGKGRQVLIFGHLTIPGIDYVGSESGSMSRGRDFDFPLEAVAECFPTAFVANGHYHRQQTYRTPQGFDIHVPGSLEKLRFDEESNRSGYLKVSWKD